MLVNLPQEKQGWGMCVKLRLSASSRGRFQKPGSRVSGDQETLQSSLKKGSQLSVLLLLIGFVRTLPASLVLSKFLRKFL